MICTLRQWICNLMLMVLSEIQLVNLEVDRYRRPVFHSLTGLHVWGTRLGSMHGKFLNTLGQDIWFITRKLNVVASSLAMLKMLISTSSHSAGVRARRRHTDNCKLHSNMCRTMAAAGACFGSRLKVSDYSTFLVLDTRDPVFDDRWGDDSQRGWHRW